MPTGVVSEFDSVILRKDTNYKVIRVVKNKTISFCKDKFQLDNLIGQTYGGSYKAIKGHLVKLSHEDLLAITEKTKDDEVDEVTEKGVCDNRDLIDKRENQKLTKEEINQLRKDGASGNDIVEQLIENSSTFSKKTEYSKEKYIKKKTRKHVSVYTLMEANTRNLLSMYYIKGPTKICNLRMDSLAQILTNADVSVGKKCLVVDNCSGVVVGSMMEKLNGQGAIVNVYTGTAPSRPAIELGYNFDAEQKTILHEYPLDELAVLDAVTTDDDSSEKPDDKSAIMDEDSGDEDGEEETDDEDGVTTETKTVADGNKRRRQKDKDERDRRRAAKKVRLSKARELLKPRDMDGLIVASKVHPTNVVVNLMKFLRPSSPIVVFCPYLDPLIDCYSNLRESGNVIKLKLTDTWLRSYQILTGRSHPHVNMSGSGGYLLTGIFVENNKSTN